MSLRVACPPNILAVSRITPIPCVLLGKLAVDNKYRGKGFGKYLLYDALKRIKNISSTVGCNAVIVEALDTSAAKFYKKYGFIQFTDKEILKSFFACKNDSIIPASFVIDSFYLLTFHNLQNDVRY